MKKNRTKANIPVLTAAKDLTDAVLRTIANYHPYTYEQIKISYAKLKSIDLVLQAVEVSIFLPNPHCLELISELMAIDRGIRDKPGEYLFINERLN